MKLKTLFSERLLSWKALILAITAVVIAVCLAIVFSGCTKEEVSTEATRQLVIPSEYEPEAVLPTFGGNEFQECVFEAEEETENCRIIQRFIEAEALEEDFIKGYARGYWIYTLKSGEEIGVSYTLLEILVLKYKSPESAEEAFKLHTEFMEFEDLVLDGVKMKWRKHAREPIVYMLQSKCFIIYISGHTEASRDAISTIIELYSVPKDNDY